MKYLAALVFTFFYATQVVATELNQQAYELLKQFYSYDTSYPLRVETVRTFEQHEHLFQKISFDSFHDGKVSGLLALPKTGDGPHPVILLLHGVTGHKEQWLDNAYISGGEVTAGLLREGYAVLALDAQYHGDRSVYNNYIDVGDMIFQKGWGVRYANMLTQSIVDYRRAIDYLATLPNIDTDRLGVLGYSMGGHMSFMLSAIDERVKATVACVVPHTPGMPMAAGTFARDLGDTPLLMMMAEQDQFYTVDQAKALFQSVPGEHKEIRFYDSGHSLPSAYADESVAWLKANL